MYDNEWLKLLVVLNFKHFLAFFGIRLFLFEMVDERVMVVLGSINHMQKMSMKWGKGFPFFSILLFSLFFPDTWIIS